MRSLVRLLHAFALIALAVAAVNVRTPYLHQFGALQLAVVLAGCALLALRTRVWTRRTLLIIALLAVGEELEFQSIRERVLSAPPERLVRLGRHVIVGYDDADRFESLVERRAIGGVYLTHRNVRHRTIESVRADVDRWQAKGARFVAADQEGGPIAWMSPPLPHPPSLASLVDEDGFDPAVVSEHARQQAIALRSIGVNVNFAPVVDLAPGRDPSLLDVHTRIAERAIGRDPELVSAMAEIYSAALLEEGVIPTLKHFPGLGRVAEDTHHFAARLDADPRDLEASDWRPFREIAGGAFLMLAHVRLTAVDASQPASLSKPVIDGIIRGRWQHDGVLITDDLCMAPAFYGVGGIGASAVSALNAGVDLLLISFDEDQYFRVMNALLEAEEAGLLDRSMMVRSRARLDRMARLTERARLSEIAPCDPSSGCS